MLIVNSLLSVARRMAVSVWTHERCGLAACRWGASPPGWPTGARKCPAKAVATTVGSGLGDAAEITPWDKHVATGSPVSQLRSTKPQEPDYLGSSGVGRFVVPTAVMLLGGVRGCWYQLSRRPCCGVKMGVTTRGCSSWGSAQAHR